MGDKTKIEWTEATWNPLRGCTRVSPGCGGPGWHGGCYAEAVAARFSDLGQPFHGFAKRTAAGPRWTGKVAIMPQALDLPLRWRRPRMVFANSMSDMFHEALSIEEIATIFAVAVAGVHMRRHTIQILTKRAARMRETLNDEAFWRQVNAEAGAHVMERVDPLHRRSEDARATLDDYGPDKPPRGIWLGVSAEDQQRADERVPDLLATPSAVRFVSGEPLLGAMDFRPWLPGSYECGGTCGARLADHPTVDRCTACGTDFGDGEFCPACGASDTPHLDWIIAGGESGPKARPMHPDWARSTRDQCEAAGVPFFFKQWGSHAVVYDRDVDDPDWQRCDQVVQATPRGRWLNIVGGHGFHNDRVVRVNPVGKRAAGRLLDGREHNEMPELV